MEIKKNEFYLFLFISLFNVAPIVCMSSFFFVHDLHAVHCVISSFAIILMRKRHGELVALL